MNKEQKISLTDEQAMTELERMLNMETTSIGKKNLRVILNAMRHRVRENSKNLHRHARVTG